MAINNSLKTLLDLPVWEWMRFAPSATATPSAMVGDWNNFYVGGTGRFGYYIVGAVFYRYDTWTDSWHTLAATTNGVSYDESLIYNPVHGLFGKAIGPGPGSNTIQIGSVVGSALIGQKILITSGLGAGQERTITAVTEPTVHDSGFVTSYTAGPPTIITDATTTTTIKAWKKNQWRDYQLRITYTSSTNTGQNQVRRILYNTYQSLYITDQNYASIHSWYYPPLAVALTNNTAWYQIESSIVTVDSAWTTPPDSTSKFVVKGGGLWLLSGTTSAPYYTLSYYSVLEDVWYYKGTQNAVFYSNTWSTYENALETCGECEGGATTNGVCATPLAAKIGAISVASAPYDHRTLVDASQNMSINKYANMMIRLTGGSGAGQTRAIIANNQTTFIIGRDWDVLPDSTTSYQVIGDSDKLYFLPGRTQSVMGQYSVENDVATPGRQFDFGMARTNYVELAPLGIATVTIGTGGSGGSYAVGDILTLTNNSTYYGIGGKVKVASVSGSPGSKIVATVTVINAGANYIISGTAYNTTSGNEGGGSGTGCTITVVSNTVPAQPALGTSIATAPTRTTGGILSVTINTGATGTGYTVNDQIQVTGGGSNAYLRISTVSATGQITGIAIEAPGSGYAVNASVSYTNLYVKNSAATDLRTAATPGAGGLNIVSIVDVATVTTSINHNLTIGDVVNIGGLDTLYTNTSQTYFGGLRVVTSVPALTTFTYNMCGATSATVTATVVNGAIATAVVNAGGSGYSVNDVLTCNTGGSGGTVKVVAVNAGVVTGVTLLTNGSGYSAGSSNTSGGGGSSCTITLTINNGHVSSLATTATTGSGYGILSSTSTYTAGTGIAMVVVGAAGTGYNPGDLLLAAGGLGGIVKVLTVTGGNIVPAGAVLSVQIMAYGQGYSASTQGTTNLGNSPTATTGGGSILGSGCTIVIGSVGSVYSVSGAGNLLVNVTAVTSVGALSTVAVASAGSIASTGYVNASTQTLAPTATAGVFNTEVQSTILLIDLAKNWQPNELVGKILQTQVMGLAGAAQMRRITANTNHSISIAPAITLPVSGTTKYVIHDPKALGTEASFKSDPLQYSWGVATGGSTGALTDAPTGLGNVAVNFGGSGYSVNDVLTLTTGGTLGTIKVTSVSGGIVTGVTILTQGSGYTGGVISATTAVPSNGTGCLINITNTNAKNWQINRWAGYKVKIIAGTGVNSNPNELLIASNTASTLTFATGWTLSAIPDATTVYAIMDNWGVCVGSATSSTSGLLTVTITNGGTNYQVGDILLVGTGVGGYLKVLTVGASGAVATVQILNPGSGFTAAATGITTTCATGTGSGCVLTTSTITAFAGSTFWNDPYQNWGANTTSGSLVGKMIRPIAGSSATGVDYAITSVSNATQIVTSAVTPDGNTTYSIFGEMSRTPSTSGGVSSLMRIFGTSLLDKARYMISWRGFAMTTIDRYDICQDIWEPITQTPLTETYSLGSMFEYNGKDRIYFTKDTTGRIMYYDLVKNIVVPCSTVPYGMSTAIQGNRMFTMSTPDLAAQNLEYLYVMRHTGQEMWRLLIYW